MTDSGKRLKAYAAMEKKFSEKAARSGKKAKSVNSSGLDGRGGCL